jgi:hypothetical protein
MNSYAFVEWFKARTPIDVAFAEAYAKKAYAFDHLAKDAEFKPVPAHSSNDGGKSATVVAMQLLKRNRNITPIGEILLAETAIRIERGAACRGYPGTQRRVGGVMLSSRIWACSNG